MPECEAVLGEKLFGGRSGHPCAEGGLPRHGVDRDQFVETAQVDRQRRAVLAAVGIEATDHAGAAAEGHHGHLGERAPLQQGVHLVVGRGDRHTVWRGLLYLLAS